MGLFEVIFGFRQVPEFFAHNPLEKVEELLEDDYGMIERGH